MTKPMSETAVNKANEAIKALFKLTRSHVDRIFVLEIHGMVERIKKEIKKGQNHGNEN